jgi:predicted PurR-regulated permease PerM
MRGCGRCQFLIVLIFVIFILLGREDLRDRMLRLAGSSRLYLTTQALDDAARRVSRYLLMQFAVNAVYGALVVSVRANTRLTDGIRSQRHVAI